MLPLHTIVYDNPLERDPKLLPHFLNHYSKLGVTEFIIAVIYYQDNETEIVDYVRNYCKEYNASIFPLKKSIIGSHKDDIEKYLKSKHYVKPNEYIIYADIDEFFEYPAPMSEIIDEMNKQNIWCICSNFNDRISSDGSLVDIVENINLGKQFVLGCTITNKILQGWTQKVILQRGRVVLQSAAHHDTKSGMLDRYPIGNKSQYFIHHFKWRSGLIEQIEHRLKNKYSSTIYTNEQKRFMDYYRFNNNKININDKKLNIKYYGELKYFN